MALNVVLVVVVVLVVFWPMGGTFAVQVVQVGVRPE